MIKALNTRQEEDFINLLKYPDQYDHQIDQDTSMFFGGLIEKLKDPNYSKAYFSAAENALQSTIIFTGFLNHNQLKTLIACSDITAVPSIFPEAFGLVAVESLASGVIPVQTNHSGVTEVIGKYVKEFSDIFVSRKLEPLYLDGDLALNIANNIISLIDYYQSIEEEDKKDIRARARKVSVDNYSWLAMVDHYLLMQVSEHK